MKTKDDHEDDIKEAGGTVDGAEEASPTKKLKTSRIAFSLDHIDAVGRNTGNFRDFSAQMAFTGRGDFAASLANALSNVIEHEISEDDSQFYIFRGTAFVYSSVPGVGKTRSMLELRNTISRHLKTSYTTASTWETGNEITIDSVHFGYSGFNSHLHLSNDEINRITDQESAQRVLFRRIVGSVLVQTPSATSLPKFDALYKDCDFPSVDDLNAILVGQLRPTQKASGLTPEEEAIAAEFRFMARMGTPDDDELIQKMSLKGVPQHVQDSVLAGEEPTKVTLVLVGVDEVQLLNKAKTINGEGLGRLFLRYIREWQTDLIEQNILLVAVGTGVTLDFSVDGLSGQNEPISGTDPISGTVDAVLITKEDFRALAVAKYKSMETEFDLRYGEGARETICDKAAVLWWPRVRLIEKWNPTRVKIPAVPNDSNSESWLEWMTRWILDKPFHINKKKFLPGDTFNTKGGVIGAVFEMWCDIWHYKVIPDFANIESMVGELVESTPKTAVRHLYSYLSHMASMDPSDHVFNATSFEKYGFHVIGASLYFGIQVLSEDAESICEYNTPVHAKRLGLAKWVHSKLPGFEATSVLVLGTGGARKSAFYPYTDKWQTTLLSEVKRALECQDKSYNAVFIHTGDQAKCDYLYLFRVRFGEKWIALVGDGKFTDAYTGTLSASDQIELIDAAICLKLALGDQLLDHRALFFTNRDKETVAGTKAYEEAAQRYRAAFEDRSLDLERINEETFEFSPFSNVLFMRRNRNERR